MLAARLNFMAQDNPAIQYAAKEICRNMARPEVPLCEVQEARKIPLGC